MSLPVLTWHQPCTAEDCQWDIPQEVQVAQAAQQAEQAHTDRIGALLAGGAAARPKPPAKKAAAANFNKLRAARLLGAGSGASPKPPGAHPAAISRGHFLSALTEEEAGARRPGNCGLAAAPTVTELHRNTG